MLAGAYNIARAADPSNQCSGQFVETWMNFPDEPADWQPTGHTCLGKCPPGSSAEKVYCMEITMGLPNPQGVQRFQCACRYITEHPDGSVTIRDERADWCDSYVDREPGTGAVAGAFCQGACISGVCTEKDVGGHNQTREKDCVCE